MSIPPPRIAVVGLSTETNTFSTRAQGADEFTVHGPDTMADVLPWDLDAALAGRTATWLPILHARSLPGGPVDPDAYDGFRARILDGLATALPLDGVVLLLHGAMAVAGRVDLEEDLLASVRGVVGPDVLLSLSMDPHGNVSPRLVALADLLTCHRFSPHVDEDETRRRAASTLLECLATGTRPVRAHVDVPILLPGEATGTDAPPGRDVFPRAADAARREGVIDAGIWIGFAWADEARCRGSVVVTGTDPDAVAATATDLAHAYWDARHGFHLVADHGDVGAALRLAATAPTPVLLTDTGDNVTAGAPGDSVHLLAALWREESLTRSVLVAGLLDEPAVAALAGTGPGRRASVVWGAGAPGGPVPAEATVVDRRRVAGGLVLRVRARNVTVLVSDHRREFTTAEHFADVGVDPARFDVVVCKNGYLFGYQREIAATGLLVTTPGPTDLDLSRLGHRRLVRPLFPFEDPPTPDLTPTPYPSERHPT